RVEQSVTSGKENATPAAEIVTGSSSRAPAPKAPEATPPASAPPPEGATGRERALVLNSARHWEAVTSPTRFEILEQMRSAAPCSVAELARQMDRPADRLYHHLRELQEAGLIRGVGQRPVGKQVETIYDLAYDTLLFEIEPTTGRNVNEMRKLSGALLRLAGRVFDAALGNPGMVGTGPGQNTWGRLDTTWLTDEGLAELNDHLQAIRRLLEEGNRRREGHLITIGTFGGPALRPRRADGVKASRKRKSTREESKDGRPERMHRISRVQDGQVTGD